MSKSKSDLKFKPVTDFEILSKTLTYLIGLYPVLRHRRLVFHCCGAIAALFELYYYLKDNNLKDYGNYTN